MRTLSPINQPVVRPASAERRVHGPLDAGDLDLDPTEEVDGLDMLLAAMWGLVAAPAGLPVEGQQGLARLWQLGGRRLVGGHGFLRVLRAYPNRSRQGSINA